MQSSNVLLVLLCVAAVVLNPLSDRIGAFIARFFARLDRTHHPRASFPPSRPSLGSL
jgi:hypothetical protein